MLNQILATGAVFAVMRGVALPPEQVDVIYDANRQATNAMWCRFDFLKTRYRITVTMDPADSP